MSDDDLRERLESLEADVRALRAFENAPYRAVVDDMTELVVRWRPDGTRVFVNEAYCRLFGTPRDQIIGSSFWPLIDEQDRRQVRERIARLSLQAPVSTGRHRARRPSGETFWMEWTDRAIFDVEGRVVEYQSVGRDITDRMRLEEQLRRIEQADAVARTSAAIAHDLSGLMLVITLQSEHLASGGAMQGLDTLQAAAKDAMELLRQLQQLTYGSIRQRVPFDLGLRVHQALPLLRELVGDDVTVVERLSEEPCVVQGDPVQLDQILLNLVRNAADASARRIDLSTRRSADTRLSPAHRGDAVAPHGWCLLRVADDGTGIAPALLPKIFDVHVTTKTAGQGIGLATVQAIVQAHGGSIAVESSRAGTAFEIALPLVAPE